MNAFNLHQKYSKTKIIQLSYADAIFYSLMVGSGETFIAAFALAQGVSQVLAGMVSVLPLGLASILQLWSGRLATRHHSPRRWVVGCAVSQGLSLLALGGTPLVDSYGVYLMFLASLSYWFFGLSAGPTWNIWMAQLIEPCDQRRFFSRRTFYMQGAALISLIGSGCLLYFCNQSGISTVPIFSGLMAFAACARLFSAYFLSRHPEPVTKTESILGDSMAPVVKTRQKRTIWYGFIMTFSLSLGVYISAPYFSPYMLKELNLDYLEYGGLLAIAFVARMFHSFAQSSIMKSVASRSIFLSGLVLIAPLPVLWTLSADYGYLLFLQVWSGIAWGCYELGLMLFLLEKVSGLERMSMLTWFNTSSAFGMLAGMFIGAWLLTPTANASLYHRIFSISSAMRLLPFLFIIPFLKAIKFHEIPLSFVGIRAGGRSVVRPIFLAEETPLPESNDNLQK